MSEYVHEQLISETRTPVGDASGPYLLRSIQRVVLEHKWNPQYNEDSVCKCGHPYHRHFDPYQDMEPVGCKYCSCFIFVPED